MTKSSR